MAVHRKVYLEITNCCNLKCEFCPGTRRKPGSLTMEEFLILAQKVAPWAEFLYFHLMGEPTAHPLLPEFIAHAKALSLKPMITTNGTLLSARKEELLGAGLHKINVSLHAFEANHMVTAFEEYVGGCVDFAKEAADRETIAVLRLWNLDGRAEGALNEKNQLILEKLRQAFPEKWEETRSGYRLAHKIFLEWGEKFDWPDGEGEPLYENGFCYGLRDQIGVLVDGTVVPCCLDSNGDIPLGNLFEDSLEDILNSPRAKNLYDGFTHHRCTEELCKRCMRSAYYR